MAHFPPNFTEMYCVVFGSQLTSKQGNGTIITALVEVTTADHNRLNEELSYQVFKKQILFKRQVFSLSLKMAKECRN